LARTEYAKAAADRRTSASEQAIAASGLNDCECVEVTMFSTWVLLTEAAMAL
jgi:hypothetical protein